MMDHPSLDREQDRLSDHESDRKALAFHDHSPARRSCAVTATINGTAACRIATTAAKAKGYIESLISLTKTKLLPQFPELTSRLTQSAKLATSPIRLPQIGFGCRNAKRAPRTPVLSAVWAVS